MTQSGAGSTFDEEPLLTRAMEHPIARFRHDCAHARHAADAAAFLDGHLRSVEDRTLEMSTNDGGQLFLKGWLDPVGGATVRTALEPLAWRLGPDDTRPRPHLQVTAPLDTLRGLPGAPAGELEHSSPIPTATVQRLACDAAVTRILLGPDSAIVDVGRSQRVVPGATRRALNVRDRGCRWPGCERPASWTAAHHLTHWVDGGETNLDNLALICHRHHWLIHEGGWQLVRGEGGRLAALPPPYGTWPRAPDHATA